MTKSEIQQQLTDLRMAARVAYRKQDIPEWIRLVEKITTLVMKQEKMK